MAVNLLSGYDHGDDEYIDMEISSFSSFLCHSRTSNSQPREFEFQMSSIPLEKETTTSPADELFYKGKLLPLHLPPRLQMVEKLLEHSNSVRRDTSDEFYSTPLMTTLNTPTTTSTPFESCHVSPSGSCQVSMELSPDEYFAEYSNGFMSDNSKKSWTKKLKQSAIGSRLRASRAYLRSLFGKSGCSDDSCTAAAKVADEGTASKSRESSNRAAKKAPFGQIQKDRNQMPTSTCEEGSSRLHRRSFSMALKRHSIANKSSSTSSSSSGSSSFSSSSSSSLTGGYRVPFLKRSNSVNAEMENPIQGAIAHCKQSQAQKLSTTKTAANEIGVYTLSTSKLTVCEEQEHCRG